MGVLRFLERENTLNVVGPNDPPAKNCEPCALTEHYANTRESVGDTLCRKKTIRFPRRMLSKAFALSSASDTARDVRDEVGFFQTVRAAMVKASDTSGRSAADRDLAIRQIVNGAVASTEIVDILSAAGLSSPDISILSDEFLAEIGQMEKKNLALEALKKLLNDEIRTRSRSNVIETRKFSERLEEAISRYHTNAISTVEVLQELIALAKEVREARNRGEETGLTPEEIAFYDALAGNQSAVDILGNDQLKIIAHELLKGLKANVSIDWAHRDSARARLRVLVKRSLRKYGQAPDPVRFLVRHALKVVAVLPSSAGLSVRRGVDAGSPATLPAPRRQPWSGRYARAKPQPPPSRCAAAAGRLIHLVQQRRNFFWMAMIASA